MAEFFFVLTVIYGAYVIFVTINDKKKTPTIDASAPAMMSMQNVKPLIPENIKTQPLVKPVATTKTAKTSATKTGLKNPSTGEVVTGYTNYRFMKRWIKEALVTEGLLEKIYKNNELDDAVEAKIKEGIHKLEQIEAYKI